MEKNCFKCGKVKPLSEFYRHSEMADGHLNKCKECARFDSNTHRWSNLEKVREYDRNRPNAKERTEEAKKRKAFLKKSDPERFKEAERARLRNYRRRNKEKAVAHEHVFYAVSTGKIKNPGVCSKCGALCHSEAHHEDYSKPLEIVWLCDLCHKARHKEMRAALLR